MTSNDKVDGNDENEKTLGKLIVGLFMVQSQHLWGAFAK
jgi:hypothetical protein